jgi:hypothetical protein
MSDRRLPVLLITDDGRLETDWPFVGHALRRCAAQSFEVRYRRVESPDADVDPARVRVEPLDVSVRAVCRR